MKEETKFIADASLGKLAKWLRLLGYDTIVYPEVAGRNMLNQSLAQKRVVLTRRRDMMERQFAGRIILIPDCNVVKQLRFLIEKVPLNIKQRNMYSLCVRCNKELVIVSEKNEVRECVPHYVYNNYTSFTRCPGCGKVYWQGTHLRNALNFIGEINGEISNVK
ncbi:MAG TPA: Mut7-C RNAse domain-containing protein [Smithellaceae bacterium]|nr:Mut7-C RNAse domain-containing protein [Smithellaceae bacterium]